MMDKVIFIGWEGAVVSRPANGYVTSLNDIQLVPGVMPALRRFTAAGYAIVASTNRPADTLETAIVEKVDLSDDFVCRLFRSQGIDLSKPKVCIHSAAEGCSCRKPGVGLIADYLPKLDRNKSAVIESEAFCEEFARNVGVQAVRLEPSSSAWQAAAHRLLDAPRVASVRRKTRETDITVDIDLDLTTDPNISTGLAFFDHMLEQLGKHGSFALTVNCKGDLEVDEHHTIEDVALAIGAALRQALGDKRGIKRYGFLLPMDEAQAQIAIDIGGRAYLVFEGTFPRLEVGGMPTELVEHFFRSLSDALGASLHIRVSGENTHHMIEACFKGVARAIGMAKDRSGDVLPSTKGQL